MRASPFSTIKFIKSKKGIKEKEVVENKSIMHACTMNEMNKRLIVICNVIQELTFCLYFLAESKCDESF